MILNGLVVNDRISRNGGVVVNVNQLVEFNYCLTAKLEMTNRNLEIQTK